MGATRCELIKSMQTFKPGFDQQFDEIVFAGPPVDGDVAELKPFFCTSGFHSRSAIPDGPSCRTADTTHIA